MTTAATEDIEQPSWAVLAHTRDDILGLPEAPLWTISPPRGAVMHCEAASPFAPEHLVRAAWGGEARYVYKAQLWPATPEEIATAQLASGQAASL